MESVNPKLLIALGLVIAVFLAVQISNPHRKYSSQRYWQTATLASVADIPDGALEPGNRNGGVLMWAAMFASDPQIVAALVRRGADVNESDGEFMGTPLTGAAGYSSHPAMIDALIRLGAKVDQRVNNDETALFVAARHNAHPGIVERLVFHGADAGHRNAQGRTALDVATASGNEIVRNALITLGRE